MQRWWRIQNDNIFYTHPIILITIRMVGLQQQEAQKKKKARIKLTERLLFDFCE